MSGSREIRFSLVVALAAFAALCAAAFFCADAGTERSGVPAEFAADGVPAAGTSAAPFEFPSRLRVASYNLHNYRDENRFSEKGKFLYKYPKPEKEKEALCRTILAVRPDVLAVQEIGGEPWLAELAERLAADGLAFPYRALLEGGGDCFNRLAVLSRVPFSKTVKIAAPKKLTRGLLGVMIPVAGGDSLYVYTVHLKSKISSDPDDPECVKRRTAEARLVRRLIDFGVEDEKTAEKIPASTRFRVPDRLEKDTPKYFVLVGDFNDVPASPSLAALEASTFSVALPAKNDDGGVLTYFNPRRGYFFTYDRMFASPALFRAAYVPGSAKIAEFPWSQTASDHRLIYADFDFEGTPEAKKESE